MSILAKGDYEGKTIDDPEVRNLFTLETLLESDWYRRRLVEQQDRDVQHWTDFVERLQTAKDSLDDGDLVDQIHLDQRLSYAKERLAEASTPEYLEGLVGTIGADPMRVSANDPVLADRLAGV